MGCVNCRLGLHLWLGGGLIQIDSYLRRNWLQTETVQWITVSDLAGCMYFSELTYMPEAKCKKSENFV